MSSVFTTDFIIDYHDSIDTLMSNSYILVQDDEISFMWMMEF